MKQTLYAAAALTALTSAVFLSGCAGTQTAPSSAENDIPDYTTPQAQIDLMVDNRDLWLALAEEDAYDVWAYTVTDLEPVSIPPLIFMRSAKALTHWISAFMKLPRAIPRQI